MVIFQYNYFYKVFSGLSFMSMFTRQSMSAPGKKIKTSKLKAMQNLERQVGNLRMNELLEGRLILIRNSKGEMPTQSLVGIDGMLHYDSGKSGTLPYDCFIKDGSNFMNKENFIEVYNLRANYIKAYQKSKK